MDYSTALTEALKSSGMRDEEVAVKANVSIWTVINIRSGRTKTPQRLVIEALKSAVPGFAENLTQNTAAA